MLIDEIRECICVLENKGYKIQEIRISKDIFDLINNAFNKFYDSQVIEIGQLITLFGYDCSMNIFDDRQVVFITEINGIDILKQIKGVK